MSWQTATIRRGRGVRCWAKAGRIASSHGNAMATPAALSMVRRVRRWARFIQAAPRNGTKAGFEESYQMAHDSPREGGLNKKANSCSLTAIRYSLVLKTPRNQPFRPR